MTYTILPMVLFGIMSLFVWLYQQVTGGMMDLWTMFSGSRRQCLVQNGKVHDDEDARDCNAM